LPLPISEALARDAGPTPQRCAASWTLGGSIATNHSRLGRLTARGLLLASALLAVSLSLRSRSAQADWDPRAETLMARGQYRMAGSIYRKRLKDDPTDAVAPLGIARAQAATGRCGVALKTLEAAHSGPQWDIKLSLSAAHCYALQGEFADAVYFIEEALAAQPQGEAVLLRALVVAHQAGDPVLLARVESSVADVAPATPLDTFARALRYLDAHDYDGLFMDVHDLRRSPVWRTRSDLLATRAWLALDNPSAAIKVAVANIAAPPRPLLVPWLAEAFRRDGQPDHAMDLLTTPKQRRRTDLIKRAFFLRVAADALVDGDLYEEGGSLSALDAQARDLLQAHPLDPQVIITAWYLAGMVGDDARATELAATLARVSDDADAELARVVPLHLRSR